MKNKFLFCLSIFVTSVFFPSCKNDSDKKPDEPIEKNCSITKIDYQDHSASYEYDDSGRIQKYINHYPNYQQVFEYKYKNTPTLILRNIETTINADGNAISNRRQYEGRIVDRGDVTFYESTQYFYNQDGYLIKEIFSFNSSQASFKDYTTEINYTYEFGNLMTFTFKDQDGKETIWKYTYYEDKPNQLAEFEQKLDFKGKKNKNLIKTREEIKSGTPLIYTYTYTFDSKGNLATQTASNPDSKDLVTTYTWTCK